MIHKQLIRFIAVAFFITPILAGARPVRAGGAAERLQRPLIIGASVSSGFLTKGPGERAAAWYQGTPTNVAHSGASGHQFSGISGASLAPYTSIIAVDFLFWDSTSEDVGPSLAALRRLEAAAERAHVPLVLGDIPNLIGTQVSRDVLNQAIHSTCRKSRGCLLLNLDQLHRQAYWAGVPIDGESYHYSRLTFDGLHLNERGADYVARMIVDVLNEP